MSSRIKEPDPNEDTHEEAMGTISSPGNEAIIDSKPIVVDGKQDVVELDNAMYSTCSPQIYQVCSELNCKLIEMAQKGHIDSKSCEIMQHTLGILSCGERCLIPQLIDENQAATILGKTTKELRESKYLRKFRHCNVLYYFNTEVYELLDRREHCPRRAANNPALKNRKDRASVRARKTYTDAIIRGAAHEFTAKEKKCMSIDFHIQGFVSQGQCCAESHIKPREIYDILQSFTNERGPLVENLAFLCSKFGCENEADLSYLLEATEDEIHELLSTANLKIEGLARYWESC